VTGLQVYDASGGVHSLTATLTNNRAVTTGSWLVSVTDESGAVVGSGEIRFATTGSLTAGYTSMTLNLAYNGSTQSVVLGFGTAGAFNGTTQITGAASSIGGKVADGHGVIGISSYAYDDAGNLQITYTDGETRQGPQLALADVADEQQLQLHEGAMYVAPPGLSVNYGKASDAKFGSITGGSLESSNVDLTTELTEMIIVQRGYQASSRVLTVTDAMLQQLYSATGGGGG
jgi:flagellar hook protein FlgE